ncbi:ABC transporter ATP-binding protein [Ferroacidibacillus organovorans]|uniref:ABC transporter domain-containing protein n=1 Tax=Ferroacidibacillus organovorans TaxID=1765683 RepID=A0A101XRY6_9BACL|nr:ABC transporter ATP-binding protein [Ferroacidibacillus organovorans]KUO96430.1 hypothetical protein ATW55_00895 [Ferroacidibacillus organovorans]
MSTVIEMENVSKVFGKKRAVHSMSFVMERGHAVALLGPNGAGKTTSIAMMLGLTKPTSGRVRLFDGDPKTAAAHERIGVMLQEVSVPPRLSVRETIDMFRGFYPRPLPTDRLLQVSGLTEDQKTMAQKLSGGKMRRLQFTLALAGDPDVLFLDEPTVGMDVASRRAFWDEVRTFLRAGKTLMLTTHDLQEADMLADRIVVMQNGAVIADAPPESIKMQFGGRTVSFVAGSDIDFERLRRLPDVTDVQTVGRQVTVRTQNSDALLKTLILESWDIRDIQVHGGGLEDAFVRLTEEGGEAQ